MKRILLQQFVLLFFIGLSSTLLAQPDRWQQQAKYEMEIDFDTKNHQYTGKQKLVYTNNSPYVLKKVFYHLYFNAFQPGSMMDVRSRTIKDPDARVKDRIFKLKPEEIGFIKVQSLTQSGKAVQYETVGTILEVELAEPIQPNTTVTFDMNFLGQVPLQIRRSGRNNKEGIDYSMTQWYPKMCEFDYEGWHANPYVGREFHGVWGEFDVKIKMDSAYTIGGTGYLQNPQEIGHGYEDKSKPLQRPNSDKLVWHFKAPNVHDFAWAADPDYQHDIAKVENGPEIHFFYQTDIDSVKKHWLDVQAKTVKAFEIINKKFGKYPYKQYSILQGGDGGMEYPMSTLVTGRRTQNSLLSVIIHEAGHSWFQGVLATNESKYSWMDEGFTSYLTAYTKNLLSKKPARNPFTGSYRSYFRIASSDAAEPMTVHADHYKTNRAYSINAYSKGAVFLHQLSYIIGNEAFDKGMLAYFNTWKFKHPNPTDFKRIMEEVSGLELDWYFEHWVGTTNRIDYGIRNVVSQGKNTVVTLERVGTMPMPIDVVVEYEDSTIECFYIPLRVMRGEKSERFVDIKTYVQADWPWAYPQYNLVIPTKTKKIRAIVIDPTDRMADVDKRNNVYPSNPAIQFSGDGQSPKNRE
ncbi:MAG: M1 family metallopeptidase [Flammeovirgaceae bacterium]